MKRVVYQKPERIETATIRRIVVDSKQLAKMLSVSQRTLARWRDDPEVALPYLRVGNGERPTILYLLRDIGRWLERWRQNATGRVKLTLEGSSRGKPSDAPEEAVSTS